MPNQISSKAYWQARRPGRAAVDLRLAQMLADMSDRTKATNQAYDARLLALLSRADYDRLYDAWEAGHDAPADLGAILEADQELCRLAQSSNQSFWLLFLVRIGGIPSEHYVYQQTGGKMRGPNGER
jgi:hypothetical protein